MSSILLPLHNRNTNWLQFASIGFAPISDRRMRPSPAETSLWQTDLAESIGYSWNMWLFNTTQTLLEIHGGVRMQYKWSMHSLGSMTTASTMSSVREVKHMTFLLSHCIHQSQFPLCANLSWPFILKKYFDISPILNVCCAFCRFFFSLCLNTLHFLSHLCLSSFTNLHHLSCVPCTAEGQGRRVLLEHLPKAAQSSHCAKRICPLYYFLFSTACLHLEELWKLATGNAICPLTKMFWPRTDICTTRRCKKEFTLH